MGQVYHVIDTEPSNNTNQNGFDTSQRPSQHDHGSDDTDQDGADTQTGKEGNMEDSSTDQQNHKGNDHTQNTGLQGSLDVDGLVVHEDKLLVQISNNDVSRAVLGNDLVDLLSNGDELLILPASLLFRSDREGSQLATLDRDSSVLHLASVPSHFVGVSCRGSFNTILVKACSLLQEPLHEIRHVGGVDLPGFILPVSTCDVLTVFQVALGIKGSKLFNEAVHFSNTASLFDQILVGRVGLELVTKVDQLGLALSIKVKVLFKDCLSVVGGIQEQVDTSTVDFSQSPSVVDLQTTIVICSGELIVQDGDRLLQWVVFV
mmetsp:Transcript_31950/g.77517  ORF Transcript_31950/g.77517 Transcript_31950/m.77517 type:complete len:318 (-) Transcript_31950:2082-3035(-)